MRSFTRLAWVLMMCGACGFPRPPDLTFDGGADASADAAADARSEDTACQLTAATPLARTGDSISLEGTFRDAVIVNFPGGTSVAATITGSHRASATVPETATEGPLTVTTCSATFGPVPFRRPSFAVGLGRFESSSDQANGGRQAPTLVTARNSHSVAVTGQAMYIVGGLGNAGPLQSVERARINADGALGALETSNAVLVTARYGHASVVVGTNLYALGGFGEAPLDSVERATINADGSLGSFELVPGVKLATARYRHAALVIGNSIYVLGGLTDTPVDSIERAVIGADGSLGPFTIVAGNHLATPRHSHAVALVGSTLYVVGGTSGLGATSNVEQATVERDGSLGSFAAASASMTRARSGQTLGVFGNTLYAIGGADGVGAIDSIDRATIGADGALGPFERARAPLVTPRGSHATAVVGNFLYVVGGIGTGSGSLASIERATFNVGTTMGISTTASGVTFTDARSEATIVAIGRYLYAIGGAATDGGTIERAEITDAGSVGPFMTVPGIAQAIPRRRHGIAVIGRYVYVVGGKSSTTTLNSIERATIQPDGSLGTFATVYTLQRARKDHTCVVIDKYLYVLGGDDGTSSSTSIERATIAADGSLGEFEIVSAELAELRQGAKSILLGDKLYMIGGYFALVQRSTVDGTGLLSTFSTLANTLSNQERFEATITIVGDHIHVLGGDILSGSGASERASIALDGTLSDFGVGSTESVLRSGHSAIVIGNYLHVIGGNAGLRSAVPTAFSLELR